MMRKPLVIAAVAIACLAPGFAAAKGRGDGQPFLHQAAQADRSRDGGGRRDRDRDRRGPPARPERGLEPGQLLPPSDRGAPVQDLGRRRLRAPPPGYEWVQRGRDVYLMQRSTGMVLEVIPGGY
jgi:Ni/Co efflux regulator RcnB